MPLYTRIIRDGEEIALSRGWGGWHIGVMIVASALETGEGPFTDNSVEAVLGPEAAAAYADGEKLEIELGSNIWWPLYMGGYAALALTPLNRGGYTLQRDWQFTDPDDGEVLELLAGDKLCAYRS